MNGIFDGFWNHWNSLFIVSPCELTVATFRYLSKGWNNPFSKSSFSILQVALGSKDVSVNTKVWNFVVFVPFVCILLELPWGGGLSSATFIGIASWDGFLLSKIPCTESFFSILQVGLSGNDVSIDTEIWNLVVLIPLISVFLELPWRSSFSCTSFISVACWNGLLLSKSWDHPLGTK